jgi:hypothetical protein
MTHYLLKLTMLGLALICVGCTTTMGLVQPPVTAISTSARQEVNVLAIRGPHAPSIQVSGDEIARRAQVVGAKAKKAGLGSISAGFEAGAEAGEPFTAIFMAALGIAAAPFAATGGAIYGGAISDKDEDIKASVPLLRAALMRAPERMERQFRSHVDAAGLSGIQIEYVAASTTNDALRDQGFDSVLDLEMKRLDTMPSDDLAQVKLLSRNTISLTDLDDDVVLARRDYQVYTGDKKFSTWVDQDAAPVFEALDVTFAEMSDELIDDFFVDPSIQVQGLEPIASDGMRRGRIDSMRPLIVWQALDANMPLPDDQAVEYELLLYTGSKVPEQGIRLTADRYVPDDLLQQCKRYRWKVRAHYGSFGEPVASLWSPEYRFGTPCN